MTCFVSTSFIAPIEVPSFLRSTLFNSTLFNDDNQQNKRSFFTNAAIKVHRFVLRCVFTGSYITIIFSYVISKIVINNIKILSTSIKNFLLKHEIKNISKDFSIMGSTLAISTTTGAILWGLPGALIGTLLTISVTAAFFGFTHLLQERIFNKLLQESENPNLEMPAFSRALDQISLYIKDNLHLERQTKALEQLTKLAEDNTSKEKKELAFTTFLKLHGYYASIDRYTNHPLRVNIVYPIKEFIIKEITALKNQAKIFNATEAFQKEPFNRLLNLAKSTPFQDAILHNAMYRPWQERIVWPKTLSEAIQDIIDHIVLHAGNELSYIENTNSQKRESALTKLMELAADEALPNEVKIQIKLELGSIIAQLASIIMRGLNEEPALSTLLKLSPLHSCSLSNTCHPLRNVSSYFLDKIKVEYNSRNCPNGEIPETLKNNLKKCFIQLLELNKKDSDSSTAYMHNIIRSLENIIVQKDLAASSEEQRKYFLDLLLDLNQAEKRPNTSRDLIISLSVILGDNNIPHSQKEKIAKELLTLYDEFFSSEIPLQNRFLFLDSLKSIINTDMENESLKNQAIDKLFDLADSEKDPKIIKQCTGLFLDTIIDSHNDEIQNRFFNKLLEFTHLKQAEETVNFTLEKLQWLITSPYFTNNNLRLLAFNKLLEFASLQNSPKVLKAAIENLSVVFLDLESAKKTTFLYLNINDDPAYAEAQEVLNSLQQNAIEKLFELSTLEQPAETLIFLIDKLGEITLKAANTHYAHEYEKPTPVLLEYSKQAFEKLLEFSNSPCLEVKTAAIEELKDIASVQIKTTNDTNTATLEESQEHQRYYKTTAIKWFIEIFETEKDHFEDNLTHVIQLIQKSKDPEMLERLLDFSTSLDKEDPKMIFIVDKLLVFIEELSSVLTQNNHDENLKVFFLLKTILMKNDRSARQELDHHILKKAIQCLGTLPTDPSNFQINTAADIFRINQFTIALLKTVHLDPFNSDELKAEALLQSKRWINFLNGLLRSSGSVFITRQYAADILRNILRLKVDKPAIFSDLHPEIFDLAKDHLTNFLKNTNFFSSMTTNYEIWHSLIQIWRDYPRGYQKTALAQCLRSIHEERENYTLPVELELTNRASADIAAHRENTMASSVAGSVTKSLKRLQARYQLNEQTAHDLVENLRTFLFKTDISLPQNVIESAQNTYIRVTTIMANEIKSSTQFSMPFILALAWSGANERTGEDKKTDQRSLVESMNDLQHAHGYNNPACTIGHFNGLIESLDKIHPDVNIIRLNTKLFGEIVQELTLEQLNQKEEEVQDQLTEINSKNQKSQEEQALLNAFFDKVKKEVVKRIEFLEAEFRNSNIYIENALVISANDVNSILNTMEDAF